MWGSKFLTMEQCLLRRFISRLDYVLKFYISSAVLKKTWNMSNNQVIHSNNKITFMFFFLKVKFMWEFCNEINSDFFNADALYNSARYDSSIPLSILFWILLRCLADLHVLLIVCECELLFVALQICVNNVCLDVYFADWFVIFRYSSRSSDIIIIDKIFWHSLYLLFLININCVVKKINKLYLRHIFRMLLSFFFW